LNENSKILTRFDEIDTVGEFRSISIVYLGYQHSQEPERYGKYNHYPVYLRYEKYDGSLVLDIVGYVPNKRIEKFAYPVQMVDYFA